MGFARAASAILILLIMAMPIISVPAIADGVWIRWESDYDSWSTVGERSQFGIINYNEGIEKLLISIGLNSDEIEASEKIAWIFPIPSDPTEINLSILSVVPRINGDNVAKLAMQKIRDDPAWEFCIYGSQVFTIPFVFYSLYHGVSGGGGPNPTDTFAQIQKYGLTAEVLRTSSMDALNDYMNDRELKLPSSTNAPLEYYIEENYSLMLAHISDVDGFVSNSMKVNIGGESLYLLGICAEFPTDKIFFPLKMTSAYGNEQIPITIQIIDHVTPPSNPGLGIGMSTNVNFLRERNYGPGYWEYPYEQYTNQSIQDLYYFFEDRLSSYPENGFILSLDYTQIDIRGPANGLSQDLWFEDSVPGTIGFYEAIGNSAVIIVILIFIFISALAGLFTGLIMFRGRTLQTPKWRFLMLGLFNMLTIFGIILGILLLTEARFITEKNDDSGPKLRNKKWIYMGLFSLIFLGLALISNIVVILLSG